MPEIPKAIKWFTNWSEKGVYDGILDAYDQGIEEHWDLCTIGSYLSIEIIRDGVTKTTPEVIRNALLLLLELFYPKLTSHPSTSTDITRLPLKEKRKLADRLKALF